MKKTVLLILPFLIGLPELHCQIDTIADNIYSGNGNLGIGTESPNYRLTIIDSISSSFGQGSNRDFILLHNRAINGFAETRLKITAGQDLTNALFLGQYAEDYETDGYQSLSHITSFSQEGLLLRSRSTFGSIQFHTGFDGEVAFERMRITSDGNIGIGTKIPSCKLDVAGLINTSEGIKFPDGTVQTTAASSSASSDLFWQNNNSNIFRNAPVAIGRESMESYFKSKLWVHNGWLLVSDSGYNDAGMGVIHLSKTGYGFARSLHQVYDGVTGDPYTEFRIRNNDDSQTVRSWSVGIHHGDDNKFKINTIGDVSTGSSPWNGENMFTIRTNGFVGIGTSEPLAKVEVADGDVFISDISKGIIMKSPDGKCWKGTLDNAGKLNFVPVNCEDLSIYVISNKSVVNPLISIYPNPTQNTVTVASSHYDLKNSEVLLCSVDGKTLSKDKLLSDHAVISLYNFPAGTYIIKVLNKNGHEIKSEMVIKN